MLLFIGVTMMKSEYKEMFQYISCCYLSDAVKVQQIVTECFNTSHVVIYQVMLMRKRKNFMSFNTSHVVIYHIGALDYTGGKYSFNTSHVVIYQAKCLQNALDLYSFNTSHVVIYPFYDMTIFERF